MTEKQIKDYLQKYKIASEEQLANHIEELKRNTIVNNELIFPLVGMLVNNKSVLLTFFRENLENKSLNDSTQGSIYVPFHLDEILEKIETEKGNSTRHKSRNGETHEKQYAPFLTQCRTLPKNPLEGAKETQNKTDYSEIDWEFIEAQALRMNKNKGKYESSNYKKPMDINLLKQSLLRHVLEVMKDNYADDGDELGHLSAIALNAQFLYYQLKTLK